MSKLNPNVDKIWEIREIADDFTDPLEVFREAISNAYDANATEIRISIYKAKEGEYKYNPLTIKISDNGSGMNQEQIENFWSLGFSEKRKSRNEYIGCKGHGTMIFLKSEYIQVQTTNSKNAYKSYCHAPMVKLQQGEMYEPELETITRSPDGTGTEIILEGYIKDETAFTKKTFQFDDIRDYILWFTKHGSIEKEFGIKKRQNCKLYLKVFDTEECIEYGHVFAKESYDIKQLKNKYDDNLADFFVKRFKKDKIKLGGFPNYKIDVVLYYEGIEARKLVNPYFKKNDKFTEASRYGLYLCKDYIPIKRVNEWVKSFAGGSGGYVRLHGFVNCQDFELTANRGSVSLKNKDVMEEIEDIVDDCIKDFVKELDATGLSKFVKEMKEIKTLEDENKDFDTRKEKSLKKHFYKLKIGDKTISIFEPENENEVLYIYTILSIAYPERFPFCPVDYNTNKGIDMLVKTMDGQLYGKEYAYVELKKILTQTPFNHSFSNLAYILCWEISSKIENGAEFQSAIDGKDKKWVLTREKNGAYLKARDGSRFNIQVIELKKTFEKFILKDKQKDQKN